MQKNLVGRVAKLEKEVSDLVLYYEQCDRTKEFIATKQQSLNLHPSTETNNGVCKIIKVQSTSQNTTNESTSSHSRRKQHRKRSKSRSTRTIQKSQSREVPTNMIVEAGKRGNSRHETRAANMFQNCDNDKGSPTKFSSHPEGNSKTVDLKKKLAEEMEKTEEAYQIIETLKDELNYSKERMLTMAKDVNILMQALETMRGKYKSIKTFRREKIAQIEELKKINTDLCKALDIEMKKHAEAVAIIRKESSPRMDNRMKQEMTNVLTQTQEQYDKLQELHEKLKVTCEELRDKYIQANQEIDALKMQIESQTQTMLEKNEEIESLQTLLRNEKNKNACICEAVDKLEDRVKEMLMKEMRAAKEVQLLKSKIRELENEKAKCHQEYLYREKDFKQMECECESMRKELAELNSKDITKCKKIEKEIDKLKAHMEDKEKKVIHERDHLKTLVDELSEVVQKHKRRIKELVAINRQQEGLLKNQVVMMQNKEHYLKMAEVEVEAAKKRALILEDQIDKLRSSMQKYEKQQLKKKCDCKNKLQTLQEELQNTRKSFQEEQDKLLIKEKIIDDQADTIRRLKENLQQKGDEFKLQAEKEILKLQKQLEQEKSNKQKLLHNIEDIQMHKNQLKDQINNLEIALKEKNHQNTAQSSQAQFEHQQKLLQSLELQVALKQREWELRCKLLNTEKRRAVQAAKFATQKLVDTVNDFQSQTENHKKMQTLLTKMVDGNDKIKCKKTAHFKELIKQRDFGSYTPKESHHQQRESVT